MSNPKIKLQRLHQPLLEEEHSYKSSRCRRFLRQLKEPSSTTKDNSFGGERGGAIELIDDGTTFFTNDVEDMLDLTRMKEGVVNEDDINAIISKTTDLLNKKIRK